MREQTVEDDTLGTLTWDEDLEWWTGKQEISLGHTIIIAVSPRDESSETVLEQARRSLKRVQAEEPTFRHSAANRLLALHNEEWNDGPPIDSDTFAAQMTMTEFAAYDDGNVEISYADGDLFYGHTIIVSVGKDSSVQDADISG